MPTYVELINETEVPEQYGSEEMITVNSLEHIAHSLDRVADVLEFVLKSPNVQKLLGHTG